MPEPKRRLPPDPRVEALTLVIRSHLIRTRRPISSVQEVLCISQTQVSGRFSNRIPWRPAELWALADFLDVPLAELIASADADATARRSA